MPAALAQPGPLNGPSGQQSSPPGPAGESGGPGPSSNGQPSLDLNFLTGALDSRITFTRAAGPATDGLYTDAAGSSYNSFGTNVPRFLSLGLLIEETRAQLLLNTDAPVTQTTASLSTGAYTLWVIGTGTATPSAGTATATGFAATSAGTPTTFTVTGAGTVTVTVAGSLTRFQLEAGAFATSYIPRTVAAATRAADVATMPVGSWYLTTQGTYVADFQPNGAASSLPNVISGNAGSPVLGTGGDGKMSAAIRAVTAVFAATGPTYSFGAVNKAAFAYKSGASVAATNGTAFGPAATTFSVTGTTVTFGSDGVTPGNNALDGYLRRVRYWPRVLLTVELQQVTR